MDHARAGVFRVSYLDRALHDRRIVLDTKYANTEVNRVKLVICSYERRDFEAFNNSGVNRVLKTCDSDLDLSKRSD